MQIMHSLLDSLLHSLLDSLLHSLLWFMSSLSGSTCFRVHGKIRLNSILSKKEIFLVFLHLWRSPGLKNTDSKRENSTSTRICWQGAWHKKQRVQIIFSRDQLLLNLMKKWHKPRNCFVSLKRIVGAIFCKSWIHMNFPRQFHSVPPGLGLGN